MAKYGQTFWGSEWLKALNNIDYGNRLPRGRSYASKGAVKAVEIKKNKIKAKVQGSRPKPYSVTITVPEFSDPQKDTLTDLLASHPGWLAGLLNRQLPPDLLQLASRERIALFPSQWSDLDMSCSCPDWAVPCKHLAAVVYLLANEIDLNPMLVLQLHGYDVVAALREREVDVSENLAEPVEDLTGQLQPYKPQPLVLPDEAGIGRLDLSRVPLLEDSFLQLLPAATPFHPGDFKGMLLQHLRFARKAEKYLAGIRAPKDDLKLETCVEARLLTAASLGDSRLLLQYEKRQERLPLSTWFLLALAAEPAEVVDWPPSLRLLHDHFRLALKLVQQGAVVPRLFRAGNTHLVLWEPLVQNETIKHLVSQLARLSPPDLLQVEGTDKKPAVFSDNQSALRLQSLLISAILKEVVPHHSRFDRRDFFQALFFGGRFSEPWEGKAEQVFPALQLWLKMLHLSQRDLVPVIKVEEAFPDFFLSVAVRDKRQELEPPIPLHQFKKDKRYSKEQMGVMKDLMLLQEHFPDIGQAVNSKQELELAYDSESFADVLLRMLPLLQLLGMEVLLPKSLRHLYQPQASLRLQKTSNERAHTWLSLQHLLTFDWQVAVDGQTMSEKEFLRQVKGARGIVKLRDQFIHLTAEDLQKLMKQLQDPPELSRQEAMRVLFAGEYQGVGITVSEELRQTLQELTSVEEVPLPPDLRATLRPYQRRGFEWLYKNVRVGFGSILADDMGLGKTLQTIALLLKLKHEGQLAGAKALVVAPTFLLTNWSRELEKFAPSLSSFIYHGPKRDLGELEGKDILLTSYGMARTDHEKLNKRKWQVLVIDEAQNIKNHGTSQTKAIKGLKANLKIALSGTPVENRLSEYWSIFDFTNKGFLGSPKFFNDYFARPIAVDRDQKRLDAFRRLTEPFILRRLKTDKRIISDLPDKVEVNRYCPLAHQQAVIYETLVEEAMKQVEESEGIERKGLVLKMMTALKQICNHPVQYLKTGPRDPAQSGKLQLLFDLLHPILDNQEKTLIFTQYKEMGQLLVDFLREELHTEPLFLHGSLSRKERDELVEAFQQYRHHRVFILSLKAGGTGLNLTAAQNVIHYDLWWNTAVEAQATDRAYRIGQQRNVMVYRLLCKGTLEEKIDDMIRSKKELADLTVASGEKWLGELNNSELRDLVRLSAKIEAGA